MRRLLVTTFLVAAVLTGGGQMTASAAEQGVGASPGTTGQERACQATSENKGKSQAKGLECAPAATLTFIGTNTPIGDCAYVFSGTGLQPGSEVIFFAAPALGFGGSSIGTVSATGEFYYDELFAMEQTCESLVTRLSRVEATTASGSVIVAPFTIAGA